MGRIQTEQTKEKIRQSLIKYNPPYIRNCPLCDIPIIYGNRAHLRRANRENQKCRKCKIGIEIKSNHFSLMGKKSIDVQSATKRSKNEIYFAELCKLNFLNVETNKRIFNGWDADVILTDQKIAVMWNGIWHYKQIKRAFPIEKIQIRDALKIKEILKCGYTPYIIEDRGSKNKAFVELEFKKFQLFLSGA